ncbi:unnamed protein product [Coccothraustes coccothraustes]
MRLAEPRPDQGTAVRRGSAGLRWGERRRHRHRHRRRHRHRYRHRHRHRPREAPCSVMHADDALQGELRPAAPGAGSRGCSPRWHTAPPAGGRPLPTPPPRGRRRAAAEPRGGGGGGATSGFVKDRPEVKPGKRPAAAPSPPPARPPAGGGALPWQPCCARRGHPFPSLPFLRSPPFRPRHAASPPAHQPASAGRHRSLAQAGMGRRPRPAPPRPRDRPARAGPALRAPRWAPGEAAGDAASGTGGTPALRGEHSLIPVKGPIALLVAPRLRLVAQRGHRDLELLGAPQPLRPLETVTMSPAGDSRC